MILTFPRICDKLLYMRNPNTPRNEAAQDETERGSFDEAGFDAQIAEARARPLEQEAQRQAWEDWMEARRLLRHAEGRRGIVAAEARGAEADQDYAGIIEEFEGVKTPEYDPLSRTPADRVATAALLAALAAHREKFSKPIVLSKS